MSKEKWSDSKSRSFIQSYIDLPALWNVSDSNYNSKNEKEKCYQDIQKQFGLTTTEVKNKIRIYRTTYSQELKKIEGNRGYEPKLTWFSNLHTAFSKGKIKSFVKAPGKIKSERKPKMIEIEYKELPAEMSDSEDKIESYEEVKDPQESEHHIIIEPFDPYEEEEMEEESYSEPVKVENSNKSTINLNASNQSSSFTDFGMQSNELFLKSLQATLDKLTPNKNMLARIKIQEVLYKIAYDS